VSRGDAAQLTEALQVINGDIEAQEMQEGVLERASMDTKLG
jgi:hypothetical protein